MQHADEYWKQNINWVYLMIPTNIVMIPGQRQKFLLMPIERKQDQSQRKVLFY